jgi:predicted RNase H-like HicB family nuclease
MEMGRIRIWNGTDAQTKSRDFTFTVVYLPVGPPRKTNAARRRDGSGKRARLKNPPEQFGYQVIVPLLPGLITYGRTLSEAREMARDAIRCHLEGLRKAGEAIPNERRALKGKLRIALSA